MLDRRCLLLPPLFWLLSRAYCPSPGSTPPTWCPPPTRTSRPEVLNASGAGLECATQIGTPVHFALRNSYAELHCCFDGMVSLAWLRGADVACDGKYANRSTLVLDQVGVFDSNRYRCVARGADGGEAEFVQRVFVVERSEEVDRGPPAFASGPAEVDVAEDGASVTGNLWVSVLRKSAVALRIDAGGRPVANCSYRPFCDRARPAETLTRAACGPAGRGPPALNVALEAREEGGLLSVRLNLARLATPELLVEVTASDAARPGPPASWPVAFRRRPARPLLSTTLAGCLLGAAAAMLLLAAAAWQLTGREVRLAALRMRAWRRARGPGPPLCSPGVALVAGAAARDEADELAAMLAPPGGRYRLLEEAAGEASAVTAARTGADPRAVCLVLVDAVALSEEAFAARMQALLLREATPRVYLLRTGFRRLGRDTADDEHAALLLCRIRVDARRWECVHARARPRWWTRRQVALAVRMAHLRLRLRPAAPLAPAGPGHGTFTAVGPPAV